ncbi:MAG TPA: type II toxin-antitoxin system RelE/ParE family toxin [Candidatus Absconditabacterales bacterium]|nr:type II toxin-antitoxin system RelE/ParE family toxin [Candidatus Absconditabacterales bacterium]
MLRILYDNTHSLRKDLQDIKQQKKYAEKVKNSVEQFASHYPQTLGDIKKLEPKQKNIFRLRVGFYRVIFSIDTGNQIMIVHRILQRKDAYDDF